MFYYLQDIQEPFSIDTKGQVYYYIERRRECCVFIFILQTSYVI